VLSKRAWFLLAAAFVVGLSCGSGETTPVSHPNQCVDKDHDGYGPGCTLGTDCDDNDPAIHTGCADGGPGGGGSGGCGGAGGCELPHECTDGATKSCKIYIDAGPFTRCFDGEETCVDGFWGECIPLDGGAGGG
jgi:hypothetical protein